MKERVFETDFGGHKIKIRHKELIFPPQNIATLYLDGEYCEKRTRSSFWMFSSFRFLVNIGDSTREIELRTGKLSYSFKEGFQVLIDDVYVEGDLNIRFPDSAETKKQLKGNFISYLVPQGLFHYGILMGIIFTGIDTPESSFMVATKFLYSTILFGSVFSYWHWRSLKSVFGKGTKL